MGLPNYYIGLTEKVYSPQQNPMSGCSTSWLVAKNRLQLSKEITEDDQKYELVFNIPGVSEKDVDIWIKEGQLFVQVEKKFNPFAVAHTNWDKRYGIFIRAFYLPSDANAQKMKKTFVDGVLTVDLFKMQKEAIKTKPSIRKRVAEVPIDKEPRPLDL